MERRARLPVDAALSESTKYLVYGAGAIGGTVGARLFEAGKNVTLIARGEHAAIMRQRGLRLRSTDGDVTLPVPVALTPLDVEFVTAPDVVVLLCMKSQHTQAALVDLVRAGANNPHVVCMQNGVANERLALRYFRHTYGAVVNLPAMHLTPGEVVTYAEGFGGILDTGCLPTGVNEMCEQINEDLRDAGFSAVADEHVMRQKYAKLLLNLANVLQAGISPDQDTSHFATTLRHEALACYQAGDIDCASKAEIAERQAGVYRTGEVAGVDRTGGSSWQSLARGAGNIETQYLNGEISLLGRLYGVPTPANDACCRLANELVRRGGKPGEFRLKELQTWMT